MQKLILFFALVAFSSAILTSELMNTELKSLWDTWKQINNKIYSEAEELHRFDIFVENYLKVIATNAKAQDETDLRLSLNQFADLTGEEFKKLYVHGFNAPKTIHAYEPGFLAIDYETLSVPSSVDWRKKGAVTPIKNQGQCGACWAFSAVGSLEGLHFIKTGKLLSFSEQQIVDCDTKGQDQGCNGGLPIDAFAYTEKYGCETEAEYPYKAADGKCKYNAKLATKVNTGSKSIKANNLGATKAATVIQPVSIGIEADQNAFQLYSSGIIKSGCGSQLDHGVLIVGYETIKGTEAWIVKNSWGASWGQEGYVYIATNPKPNGGSGVCGILSMPAVPTAN